MNNTVRVALITIGVGIAFAVGGFLVGRRAPERRWEMWKAAREAEMGDMKTEIAQLEEKVRTDRVAARDLRNKNLWKTLDKYRREGRTHFRQDPIVPYRRGYGLKETAPMPRGPGGMGGRGGPGGPKGMRRPPAKPMQMPKAPAKPASQPK
ncbi:MAG: hypothetical protein JXQ73_06515 [Phycisphaerae bacterium]|nr:hypothetical protein [Phycisphaerae bacterium]